MSVSTAQCRAHTHLYITLQRTCVTCPTTAIFTHSGPACAVQKLRVAFHGSFGAPALTETRRFGILFFFISHNQKRKKHSHEITREESQWPITPSTVARNSTSLRNFVHVVSPFTLEVCLALSLHLKAFIRLHAHDPSQDTSHSESRKYNDRAINDLSFKSTTAITFDTCTFGKLMGSVPQRHDTDNDAAAANVTRNKVRTGHGKPSCRANTPR